MSVSLFPLKESAQDYKMKQKLLVKTKPSLITLMKNQLINRQILKSIQGTIRTKG
jgi:hypothetical protein